MDSFELYEQFPLGEVFKRVDLDRNAGVLRDVTILSRTSLNGHRYSDAGLEDAVKKFNGVRFYIDHPTKRELSDRRGVRSMRDLAGKIVNTRKVGEQVRADIHLLNKADVRELVFAIAEMPEVAGNSIRATGFGQKDGTGQFVVDGFKGVTSVDLVTTPAGTRGLFESYLHQEEDDMQNLTVEQLKAQRPDLVQVILEEGDGDASAKALRIENAQLKRKISIARKLEEVKLPKRVLTPLFIECLEKAKTEQQVEELIEDRKHLARVIGHGVPREAVLAEWAASLFTGSPGTPEPEVNLAEVAEQLGVADHRGTNSPSGNGTVTNLADIEKGLFG